MRVGASLRWAAGLTACLSCSACADPQPANPIRTAQPIVTATPAPVEPSAAKPAPPVWPDPGAVLKQLRPEFPKGFGKPRIFVDAGHGVGSNSGNLSCLGIDEQDHNLAVAQAVQALLAETGRFHVRLSRTDHHGPDYRARLRQARAWKAAALIGLHSDVRGEGRAWEPEPGKPCFHNPDAPGFAVLWADNRSPAQNQARQSLARAVATRLAEAGFPAYDGTDYEGLYEPDPKVPGVFVDRHRPGKRIFLLNEPPMPAIIVETHHAWDPLEEARFQEQVTRDAFGQALTAGLIDYFRFDNSATAGDPRGK